MWTNSQASQPIQPLQLYHRKIGHRRRAADRGHVAEVAVRERAQRLPFRRADDVARRVGAHLHRDLRDAGQRPAVGPGERREIADDEHVGMAGDRQIGLDEDAPDAIERRAERRAERRGRDARGPQHGLRLDARLARLARTPGPMRVTSVPVRTSTPEPLEIAARGGAQRLGKRREHGRPAFEQDDPRRRSDRNAGSPSRATCRAISASAPASSTPVGPPPTMTNVSSAARRAASALALGPLEREQHAAAHLERVFQRLQARRVRPPVVVAEVRVRRAGGDDQVVVGELGAVGEVHDLARRDRSRSTSPSSTSTLRWWRRIHRIGEAMSPGDSTAIAT